MDFFIFSEDTSTGTKLIVSPLSLTAVKVFQKTKDDIANTAIIAINPATPLAVETDESDSDVAVLLRQNGRPVAFFLQGFSRVLKSDTQLSIKKPTPFYRH